MNFYKHHIGDYDAATSHLSMLEDCAYRRLISMYYRTEKPIPLDIAQVCRLIRATDKPGRQAVATVLGEFFERTEDGWHNSRCDAEIASANAQSEANRRVAVEREAKRRVARIENEHSTIRAQVVPESCGIREPSQTPDTRHQTPDTIASVSTTSTVVGPPAEICARFKIAQILSINPTHPKLLALLEAGYSVEELAAIAEEPGSRGKPMAWVLAAAEGRRRDAGNVAQLPPRAPPDSWWDSHSGIDRKGRELGMQARASESYDDFKARIFDRLRAQTQQQEASA